MKKILLILSIIMFIIIIVFMFIIKSKGKQYDITRESKLEEEEIYQNNVNGIDLVIEGIPVETREKIKDTKEFINKLKEYSYRNNLVDYGKSSFIFIEERDKGNILTLKIQAKDTYKTKVIVDINLDKNTYQFYNYK